MIKVNVGVLEHEVMFYFERYMLTLKVLDDNLVGIGTAIYPNIHKGHYFVILGDNVILPSDNKDSLRRSYSFFLILTKKALKHFKKNYPERYESVKANIKILSDSILN